MVLLSCLAAWRAEKNRGVMLKKGRLAISRASLWLAASALPMVLVSGMRWCGVDRMNYYWAFMNIRDGLSTHVEAGYYWLNRFVLLFTQDLSVVFFICAVITAVFMTLAIKHNSSNYLVSTFLYMAMGFFFYSMNSMRHFMALAIFLYAVRFMKQKNLPCFLTWILLASCFQKVVLVAIPLYFIFNIKWKAYWYGIFAACLGTAALFSRQILDFIYQFAYGFYQNIESQSVGTSWVNVGITLALSVLCILYRKKLLERGNIILLNAALCGFLFFLLTGWIPDYTRIGQYCTMLAIFLVPEILHCEPRPMLRRIYTIGLFVGFSAYLAIILWNAQAETIQLMPYQSVWFRTDYERWQSFWILPPR